ncbi:MAG: hypothetical protein P4N24_02240 [Acidobacteriota bacterium]|nr:hypothetical protein [Acidobacteriota bacterium]
MHPFLRIGRRRFLRDSALGLGVGPLMNGVSSPKTAHVEQEPASPAPNSTGLMMRATFGSKDSVWIVREPHAGFQEQLASRELARGLRNLGLVRDPVQAVAGKSEVPSSGLIFSLSTKREDFKNSEAYEISQQAGSGKASRIHFTGATPQAVLYAVFDFLERQGAFFGLDGESYPLDPSRALNLPPAGHPWQAQPRFSTRGLVPWPDFLNCVTVYNREDWRAYLEAMVRMRFNTLGVHVYSAQDQWTESFLSFEYAGAGHIAYTDTTATNRWGYLPQRTSRYGMGAPDFFADEVFGAEVTTQARNSFEAQELAQKLWAEAYHYAKQLGIRTGVGFEPYRIPDEIYRATPPEARLPGDTKTRGARIDPESVTAKDILEARLANLLEVYPMVDYVWLWEDEGMSWDSQKKKTPLSVTPFMQAYDFLRRHAPDKRLVISGWGGVTRNFAQFHKALPEDIIFSSLTDNLGWDPVSEEYGKLEGRERWPIPWLEDDPAMWLPQFHVARFVRDMDLAEQYGCQGLMGIHWRHRIMDVDAGFQSSYSWDKSLTPTQFFQHFASTQAREPRASALVKTLEDADRDRLILCTWTGQIKDGHCEINGYASDCDEGFRFWADHEPSEAVKKSQAEVARQLRALTDAASSPAEHERLNYLTRFVEFVVPYSDSWALAHHLGFKLDAATELRKQNKADEARQLILTEGVPLYLKLAPKVREVFLDYQDIISTRNDQGQLAAMHNKYERLALYRLRASMKEFLGELPPEVERAFKESRNVDSNARARAFVPTRPTLLRKGENVRISVVVPGAANILRATLFTRAQDTQAWTPSPMKFEQRRTYTSALQWGETTGTLLDYYVAAEAVVDGVKKTITSPPEAPRRFHTVTLV